MAVKHQCGCGRVSEYPEAWTDTYVKCMYCGSRSTLPAQIKKVIPSTIRVECKCGRVLQAPAGSEGKYGKCPDCGDRLLIQETDVPLSVERPAPAFEHAVDIQVGMVKTQLSTISISFHIDPHGCTYLQIYTLTDFGRSKPSTLIRLGDESYDELIAAIAKADELVRRFRDSGSGRRMTEHFG